MILLSKKFRVKHREHMIGRTMNCWSYSKLGTVQNALDSIEILSYSNTELLLGTTLILYRELLFARIPPPSPRDRLLH
jgi:hypothetical protein